jgi:folate-binding protein YgfZ
MLAGWWQSFGLVTMTGPDAVDFLHRRSTNDVKALAVGMGQPNALLERKAHVQVLTSVHRMGEQELWLLTDEERTPTLMSELQKYKILEQVTLEEQTRRCRALWLIGAQTREVLETAFGWHLDPTEQNACETVMFEGGPAWVLWQPFYQFGSAPEPGAIVIFPSDSSTGAVETRLHAHAPLWSLTDAIVDALRLEAGLPLFGLDVTEETLLPETGLEHWAVSYSKGCYLGQETVARVKTYGSVQKALCGLLLPEKTTLLGLSGESLRLAETGETIGRLTSTAYSPTLRRPIALAYLNKQARTPGQTLDVVVGGQSLKVEVCLLPFYDPAKARLQEAKRLYEAGMRHYINDQDMLALIWLDKALAVVPDFADAIEAKGVILGHQERYGEAISLMEHLLALDPERVMAHTNLSVFYMKLGDKERAETEKARATTLSFQLAMREKQQAKTSSADSAPTPTSVESIPLATSGLAPEREQLIRERIALFNHALSFNPEDPLANYGLGNAYQELGEYVNARRAYEATLAVQPSHSQCWYLLGKTLETLGEPSEAVVTYRQGMAVAAQRGDRQPLQAMQERLQALTGEAVMA